MTTTRVVLFSASEEYFAEAEYELGQTFPGAETERLGPDLGVLRADDRDEADVAAAVANRDLLFVRHLSTEAVRLAPDDIATPEGALDPIRAAVAERVPAGGEVAVQAWVSGRSPVPYGSRDLAEHARRALEGAGYVVRRAGAPHVLSLALHDRGLSLGVARVEDALSDWPGGRMRLAKPKQQVSRSEFKLEELFGLLGDDLPNTGRAVDLGASPGGWSRILRGRGLEVWAVDPGDLDRRVTADPLVHHERTTAGQFLARTKVAFDLAVNDMRMDPVRSVETMVAAAPRLRPGAIAVVTLKLGTRRPGSTARKALARLDGTYEPLHVRQLHHNRHEITAVARRVAQP